jgi:hypothetical protein
MSAALTAWTITSGNNAPDKSFTVPAMAWPNAQHGTAATDAMMKAIDRHTRMVIVPKEK